MPLTKNIFVDDNIDKARLTQAEKDSNDHKWYKDYADRLDTHSSNNVINFGGVSDFVNKKSNYDLFNDIINKKEFEYVCKPFGSEVGDLPANFTNRDIVSGKIKVLLGMEMSMPFSWKVIAVNEQATTRKEQEEYGRIKDFVVNSIMRPIKTNIEMQSQQQSKGKQLTPEEKQAIQDQIAEETQAQTPDEVRRYMVREHQDPAEVMHKQLLEYLMLKESVQTKFNKGFKHLSLSAKEVYHIGIFNGEPKLTVVNSLFFHCDQSPELDYIEDGEWATCEYRMTPSQILSNFSNELSDDDVVRIKSFDKNMNSTTVFQNTAIMDEDFSFTEGGLYDANTIRVVHCNWKSERKVGFLTYNDTKGKEQLMIVDENYKLDKKQGDIDLQWEWIPESQECWKILNDIYILCRPVQGQKLDLDNLYDCKLSYYGAFCDNLNSIATAPMDRMKPYQYYYDVILYRIELLMASDKGKILAMNIKSVPKSIGTDKFLYFMEANHIAFVSNNEEGNRGGTDVTNMVKEIDMGMVSDIMRYINIAEYIEKKCGASIGVTPQMEAQIAANEAVTNTQQNLVQSSHIIKPYYELHNNVKGNVLKGLLDCGKIAYRGAKQKKLSYVLDDMSVYMLTIDQGMLDTTTIGLFVSNSSKADEAKKVIMGLAQAAMQSQQIDLNDVVKVLRSDDINEADENLQIAQQKKQEQAMQSEKAQQQQQKDAEMRADTLKREQWDHDKEMLNIKIDGERETKLQVEAMAAMGFDPNKDEDNDGTPDVLEVYKLGVDADIKNKQIQQKDRSMNLEEDKFKHQKQNDAKKNALEIKKLNKPTGN